MTKGFNFLKRVNGYYTSQGIIDLPESSGIYFVYRGYYSDANHVNLTELLYIGKSENIQNRISQHEKKKMWERHLRPNEHLFYAYTLESEPNLLVLEAAYIYYIKPVCNIDCTLFFPYGPTTVRSVGAIEFIPNTISVP